MHTENPKKLEAVSFSVVHTLIKNSIPKAIQIERCKQTSSEDSRIYRARRGWTTQLAIRIGLLNYSDIMKEEWIPDEVLVPPGLMKKSLPLLQ